MRAVRARRTGRSGTVTGSWGERRKFGSDWSPVVRLGAKFSVNVRTTGTEKLKSLVKWLEKTKGVPNRKVHLREMRDEVSRRAYRSKMFGEVFPP